MGELAVDVINNFSKMILNAQNKEVKRDGLYGTVHINNGKKRVRIDGSIIDTPFVEAAEVQDGDRVLILLKDHTAQVIGIINNE